MTKEQHPQPAGEVLTAAWLQGATGSTLLTRLLASAKALESMDVARPAGGGLTPAKGSGASAARPAVLDKSFVPALLTREFLTHPSHEVQIVVACVLAEAIRISGSDASGGTALPFPAAKCGDALKLVCGCFARLGQLAKDKAYVRSARQLTGALAASHGVAAMCRHATSRADDDVAAAFEAAIAHAGVLTDGAAGATGDGLAARVSAVLADAIAGSHGVSEPQLVCLLAALAPAARRANAAGARVAAGVLRAQDALLHTAVAAHVGAAFEAQTEELRRLDVTDGEPAARKAAVASLASTLDLAAEVAGVSAVLGGTLVPALARHLTHVNTDVRLAVAKGFGALFAAHPALCKAYRPAYHALLGLFADAKASIRVAMLRFAVALATADPASDAVWAELAQPLASRLTDAEEAVRKEAIDAVARLAAVAPGRVPLLLLRGLGARTQDKRPAVRQAAVARIAALYRSVHVDSPARAGRFHWAPAAVLRALHFAEADAVEAALPVLLSRPAKAAAAQRAAREQPSAMALFDFSDVGAGAAATAAAAAAAPPAPALSPTKAKRGASAAASGATPASAAAAAAAASAAAPANSATAPLPFAADTPAMALACLCTHLDAASFTFLLTLMEKRCKVRAAVSRLFELRAECRTVDPQSEEGRRARANTQRLSAFLNHATGAGNDEWGALVTVVDEKVVRALGALCSEACADYAAATAEATTKVRAGAKKDVSAAFESSIAARLALPFGAGDVRELAAHAENERARRGRADAADGTAVGGVCGYVGALRALLAVASMAPQLVAPHAAAVGEWIERDAATAATATAGSDAAAGLDAALRLLLALRTVPKALTPRTREMVTALGRVCLACPDAVAAKHAATCIADLYGGEKAAHRAVLTRLAKEFRAVAAATNGADVPQCTPSWLRALMVFARSPSVGVPPGECEAMFDDVCSLLLLAVRTPTAGDGFDAKHKSVTSLKRGLLDFDSPLAGVVDAAAKALVAYVAALPASLRSGKAMDVFDLLITAFRDSGKFRDSASAGASKIRLAIDKQFIALLRTFDADVSKELSAAIFLSAESNATVRHEIQRKLGKALEQQGSPRLAAVLLLTAISEDHRPGYADLRDRTLTVVERLRGHLAAASAAAGGAMVTLAHPAAPRFYLEYAVGPLIAYQAHHSFFADEAGQGFASFQRCWHLFFDACLHTATTCVPFLLEALRRIKAHDDALAPDSNATRIVADLAGRVLVAVLSTRVADREAFKAYPGAVLIPAQYFARASDPPLFPAEHVYLDSEVAVGPQPSFKVPVGLAHGAAGTGASGTPAASQSMARRSIDTGRRRRDSDSEGDGEGFGVEGEAAESVALSPAAKRGRKESAAAATPPPSAPSASKRGSTGKKSAKAVSVDNDDANDEPDNDADEAALRATITAVVAEICQGLDRSEIADLSWKRTRGTIEAALGHALDTAGRQMAFVAIREAHNNAPEDA